LAGDGKRAADSLILSAGKDLTAKAAQASSEQSSS
jgi:hypothetical protein